MEEIENPRKREKILRKESNEKREFETVDSTKQTMKLNGHIFRQLWKIWPLIFRVRILD
jgi:hypothetical protein